MYFVQQKYNISRRNNYLFRTHLAQSSLKHDKHDSRPNEDPKDGHTDLVGDVNQVEAPMVDVGVPVDKHPDDVHRAF